MEDGNAVKDEGVIAEAGKDASSGGVLAVVDGEVEENGGEAAEDGDDASSGGVLASGGGETPGPPASEQSRGNASRTAAGELLMVLHSWSCMR